MFYVFTDVCIWCNLSIWINEYRFIFVKKKYATFNQSIILYLFYLRESNFILHYIILVNLICPHCYSLILLWGHFMWNFEFNYFFKKQKWYIFTKNRDASLAQGVLKRSLKEHRVCQIDTKTSISRYLNKTTGLTAIANNHTQKRHY